jgi:OOP family OmpA-OmpF porin
MHTTLRTVTALAITILTTPVWAQAYIGGSVGRADLNPNRSDWSTAGVSTTFDDKSSAWRLFGGYNFNKNLGLEIGYANLGEYKADVTAAGDAGRATVEVTSWQLFVTGTAPLNDKFALHGKLGAARNESKMTFSSGGVAFLASDSGGKTKTSLAWGIGASYALNKALALRADYEAFGKSGDTNNNFTTAGRSSESDPTLLSVGLQYKF